MSFNGKKRIAVCFSGQIRTWRKCVESWDNILAYGGNRDNVDVFCHFWDFNTVPNCVVNSNQTLINKVDPAEIKELVAYLKPKKLLVESYKVIRPINPNQPITYSPFLSQFYGILKAARLKKQYEIEKDIMYDVVVRSRYDAYYLTNLTHSYNGVRENTMEAFHFGWKPGENRGRVGDICWFSDSHTYNIISDYYLNLHSLNKNMCSIEGNNLTPEFVFFHYLKKCWINISANHWDIKLFRESAELSYTGNKDGFETW